MARSRSPDYERHRAQIMDAAARLFAKKGYLGTSMNDVANACQVSKPLLYHYFENKHQLLLEIIETNLNMHDQIVHSVQALGLDALDRLREYIRQVGESHGESLAAPWVVVRGLLFLEGDGRGRAMAKREKVLSFIATAVTEIYPACGRDLSEAIARLLFCLPILGDDECGPLPTDLCDGIAVMLLTGIETARNRHPAERAHVAA